MRARPQRGLRTAAAYEADLYGIGFEGHRHDEGPLRRIVGRARGVGLRVERSERHAGEDCSPGGAQLEDMRPGIGRRRRTRSGQGHHGQQLRRVGGRVHRPAQQHHLARGARRRGHRGAAEPARLEEGPQLGVGVARYPLRVAGDRRCAGAIAHQLERRSGTDDLVPVGVDAEYLARLAGQHGAEGRPIVAVDGEEEGEDLRAVVGHRVAGALRVPVAVAPEDGRIDRVGAAEHVRDLVRVHVAGVVVRDHRIDPAAHRPRHPVGEPIGQECPDGEGQAVVRLQHPVVGAVAGLTRGAVGEPHGVEPAVHPREVRLPQAQHPQLAARDVEPGGRVDGRQPVLQLVELGGHRGVRARDQGPPAHRDQLHPQRRPRCRN